jgi:hypothetical protein
MPDAPHAVALLRLRRPRRRAQPRDERQPTHQLSPSTDRQLTAIKGGCERTSLLALQIRRLKKISHVTFE